MTEHGGQRQGAGRKPSPHPLVFVGIRISAEDREFLRETGKGNVSEGARRLIGQAREAAQKEQ